MTTTIPFHVRYRIACYLINSYYQQLSPSRGDIPDVSSCSHTEIPIFPAWLGSRRPVSSVGGAAREIL